MKYYIYLLTFSVLLFSSSLLYSQGRVDGFYKGKGALEIGIGGGVEVHKKYFAGTNRVGISRTIFNANLFGAYGITKGFDVYFGLPYVAINKVKSIQDGSIYLKKLLLNVGLDKSDLQVSFAFGYSSNLAEYVSEGLSAIGQKAKVLDFRPVIHLNMESNWFVTLQGAYLYKFDPVPPAVTAALKLGKATAKYYFDFWYDFQNTSGGLDYQGTPTPDTFRKLGVSYHKVGGTFYQPLGNKFGYYVGASTVITGRNIGQGTSLNIGFIIKG